MAVLKAKVKVGCGKPFQQCKDLLDNSLFFFRYFCPNMGIFRVFFLAFLYSAVSAQVPPGAIRLHTDGLKWQPASNFLPPGSKSVVLEGNPKSEGLFTMRVELPPNAVLQPHTHPNAERVTVLEGELFLGYGNKVDSTSVQAFNSGDFYLTPPGFPHFLYAGKVGCTVQLTGMGPWEIHFVKN